MSELLRVWCTSEKLEVICASDLLYGSDDLTPSQHEWLETYIMLWNSIEEAVFITSAEMLDKTLTKTKGGES